MADRNSPLPAGECLSRIAALLILLVCALLEAGGDALARRGMHSQPAAARAGFFVAAAAVLFTYGWLVNRPPWSFGSLLGVYVVLFFVISQVSGLDALCAVENDNAAPCAT